MDTGGEMGTESHRVGQSEMHEAAVGESLAEDGVG